MLGVFKKTAAGVHELQVRDAGLRAELRRLLIMIDGKRSTESLLPMFRGKEFSTLIFELVALGLIEPVMSTDRQRIVADSVSDTEYALLTGAQLRSAIRAAKDATSELLGGRSKPWVKRLESCGDSRQLRSVIDGIQAELRKVLGEDAARIFVESVRDAARSVG